jgi:hypothetical protein
MGMALTSYSSFDYCSNVIIDIVSNVIKKQIEFEGLLYLRYLWESKIPELISKRHSYKLSTSYRQPKQRCNYKSKPRWRQSYSRNGFKHWRKYKAI